ncbi:MAG: hypothetical protein JO150_05490 [Acidobacteriaceae bacterium]|nr:hypothetical protein [Acidobacteriaceae bacterium]
MSYAYNQSALNFEPRVGFAWDLRGDGKSVIRSAYAIFVDQPIAGLVTGLVSNPPYSIPVTFSSTPAVPYVSFSNAYSLAGGSISPTSVAHNYKNANVQSWNFSFEQQLGNDYGLSARYVGSKGTYLNLARNYNQPINGVRPYRTLSANSPIGAGLPLSNIQFMRAMETPLIRLSGSPCRSAFPEACSSTAPTHGQSRLMRTHGIFRAS